MKAVALLTLTLMFFSCGHKVQDDVSEHSKARNLLNQSRYDEASLAYEEILSKDPQNETARIELATTYAARAGIDIFSLFPLLEKTALNKSLLTVGSTGTSAKRANNTALSKRTKALEQKQENILNNSTTDLEVSERSQQGLDKDQFVMDLAKKYFNTLYKLGDTLSNLALIPYVDEQDEALLNKAIELLNHNFRNSQNNYQASNYSYLLHMILVSNIIKDLFYINDELSIAEILCEKSPTDINNAILKLRKIVEFVGDKPPRAEKFNKQYNNLTKYTEPLLDLQKKNPEALLKLSEIKNSICS